MNAWDRVGLAMMVLITLVCAGFAVWDSLQRKECRERGGRVDALFHGWKCVGLAEAQP